MANVNSSGKRPRIRKSAPTVRERQEAAIAKSENTQPTRVKRITSKTTRPFKKLKLGDRWLIKIILRPLRLLGRGLAWIIPSYFINAWREVRKVVWPSRKETWRLTLAVFIFAVIFGALVAGVDKGLDDLFKKLVLK